MTIPEAALQLSISRQAVWQAVKHGRLKARWIKCRSPRGGYWNITEAGLKKWRERSIK